MSKVVYRHALTCGHASWTASTRTTGQSWCHPCGAYVGVVVAVDRKQSQARRRKR